jgi:hypothetical protein
VTAGDERAVRKLLLNARQMKTDEMLPEMKDLAQEVAGAWTSEKRGSAAT